MPDTKKAALPLIVGAGPAGLTAALMLMRRGITPRIIDRAPAPATESRALLVNHASLDMLEKSGVTGRLLKSGNRIDGVRIHVNKKEKGFISFEHIPHERNYLLLVPQFTTEAILSDALAERGLRVERGTEFRSAAFDAEGADVQLLRQGSEGAMRASWLIGADGAHSSVRKAMKIAFDGSRDEDMFSLADVMLDNDPDIPENEAGLYLNTDQPFLVRFPLGNGVHRVISNAPGILGRLPEAWVFDKVIWTSEFAISHRMTDRRLLGRAALIGDAAHIHSPAGGRGMNLGIEDAVTLAELIASTPTIDASMLSREMEDEQRLRLRHWERERLDRAKETLAFSDRLQDLATMNSSMKLFALPMLLQLVNTIPAIRRKALLAAMGQGSF